MANDIAEDSDELDWREHWRKRRSLVDGDQNELNVVPVTQLLDQMK